MLFNPSTGATISLRHQVWVELSSKGGDDATGAVNNPAKPFATAQAAINALIVLNPGNSLGVINFGQGAHGEISLFGVPGSLNLGIRGHGYTMTSLAAIYCQQTSEGGQNTNLTLFDLGGQSVNIGEINCSSLDAVGDVEGFGNNGLAGGDIVLHNVRATNVFSNGGAGALGSAGTGGAGGAGGNLELHYSRVANAGVSGGNGNNSNTGGFNGGDGASAGNVTVNYSFLEVLTGIGGAGGTGSEGGSSGGSGAGGILQGDYSTVTGVSIAGGPGGTGGSIVMRLSQILGYNVSELNVSDVQGCVVNGTFQATGPLT